MEGQKYLCFNDDHEEQVAATKFCPECKQFYCEDCLKLHNKLYKKHKPKALEDKIIFKGMCNEYQHNEKYEYFCRTHNKLCCSKCTTKIKDETHGEHSNCEVCKLVDILSEKEKIFEENRAKINKKKYKLVNESIANFEKYRGNKVETKKSIKAQIEKAFQNYEKALAERKNQLLSNVDEIYKSFKLEEYDKKITKLTNKLSDISGLIGMSEEIKAENEMNTLIEFYCRVENDLNNINALNDEINKYSTKRQNINFILDLDKFKKKLSQFGEVKAIGNEDVPANNIIEEENEKNDYDIKF